MGVSVLVLGIWLGLQISKPDDKQVNANGGISASTNPLQFIFFIFLHLSISALYFF
jgi:hypothetical protein